MDRKGKNERKAKIILHTQCAQTKCCRFELKISMEYVHARLGVYLNSTNLGREKIAPSEYGIDKR